MSEEKKQQDLFEDESLDFQKKEITKDEIDEKADSTEDMASNEEKPIQEDLMSTNIFPRELCDEMKESYIDYAMSVIVQRALPDVRDGMKPVHRRILYSMHELNLGPQSKFKKSARVVGDVLGKYHPHGDSSVYGALVRLAQDFSLRYPLVEGQGNFGSVDGDSAAAMRYTEARMNRIALEVLADIEKDTVDFIDNYDGSTKEPKVLPSKLPILLLNGVGGIAVGMATNIPPHNIGELIDATLKIIENPEVEIDELLEVIPGPDFPTGGTIYDHESIRQAYATGRGRIVTRGEAEIVESKAGKFQIIITEIPYQVNKSTLIENIANLVKDKRIIGISDLRDESDRDGMRIVIELKREAFPKKILNQLFKMTQLQESFHVNMIALVGGVQPKLMNIKEILIHFIEHRKNVITRKSKYDLRLAEARAHILEGLKIALDNIDAIIDTIRKSKTKEDAKDELIKKFTLSDKQAQAILEMRLQQLAGLERQKIDEEYLEKITTIRELNEILNDTNKVLNVIKDELIGLKEKYADKRRTRIVKESLTGFKNEDLIPNVPMIVTMTTDNYIKRVDPATYRAQNRGGKGIIGMTTKTEDTVDQMIITKTHDDLLLFTNKGRVFQLKVYEVPQASRTAKGNATINIAQLGPDEKVMTMIALPKSESERGKYLLMATKKGIVKKTLLSDYKNVRKSGLIAIKIREDDELKWVRQTNDNDNVILITRQGQSITFKESDARPLGRASMGVIGIKIKKQDDEVITMGNTDGSQDYLILTITENGFGKCSSVSQYKIQNRGGSGVKTHLITKRTGPVAGARIITKKRDGDIIIMSNNGQVIRMDLKSISISGRATQGVTLMRFKKGDDRVSCLAVYNHELFEEEATQEKQLVTS